MDNDKCNKISKINNKLIIGKSIYNNNDIKYNKKNYILNFIKEYNIKNLEKIFIEFEI
tara:strand:+ start:428 stop:601 length:174 start_codon:yes stop_codon:yes gene_type:complete